MLLFGLFLAATSVSSFDFSNSTISTYHNTTSTSASATRSTPLLKPKISIYHNITSIASSPLGPPLTTVAAVSSQTSLNDSELICDPSIQNCSSADNQAFYYSNGTYYNPYYNTTYINPNDNQTLRDICADSFDVSLSRWLATAQTSDRPATSKVPSLREPPIISKVGSNSTALAFQTHVRRNESLIANTKTQSQHIISTTSYVPQFTFTASQPCCYNCTLAGGNLQLFQWPTQTVSPPTSTYINNLGFTFISPSVYVAFQTLEATNYCGEVGSIYHATTIAFSPNDISTARDYSWNSAEYNDHPPTLSGYPPVFTKASWETHAVVENFWQQEDAGPTTFPNLDSVSSWWSAGNTNPAATFNLDNVFQYTVTYNDCHPKLSVPTSLYKVDPSWTACGPYITGVWSNPVSVTKSMTLDANRVLYPKPKTASEAAVHLTASNQHQSSTDTYVWGPVTYPTPTATDNPYSTGLAPTPKTPPEIETYVVPPPENSNAGPAAATGSPGAPGEGNFVQKTTIISFINAIPDIESPPTTEIHLGSQILSVGQEITYAGESFSLESNGGFIVGSQTVNPGQEIVDTGTTYSRASNGATLVIEGSSYTSTQVLYNPSPTYYPAFVIGTQTLHPGSQITESGTTYSLATNGATVVIDGTSTEVLGTITPSASLGGGSSGTGKGPPGAASTSTKKSLARRETGTWVSASVFLISLLLILEL
ncbi:hypothetical protein N431DRAFT_484419 [Stipitochalara longipes BDJ]|nr:hypothetical protein N431DRAFT_484419 [Stipitochalara longipes BDJ]